MSDNLHDCEAEGEHDEAARDHAGDCSALADVNQEPGNADCNAAPEGSANNLRGGGGTRAGRQPSAMTVLTPARQTARPRTRHSGQRPLRGALARGSWKAGRGASRKKRKAAQAGGASQALARSTSSRVPQRPKQLPPRTGIALARPWRQARVGAAGCEPGHWLCRPGPRPRLHRNGRPARERHTGDGTQAHSSPRGTRKTVPATADDRCQPAERRQAWPAWDRAARANRCQGDRGRRTLQAHAQRGERPEQSPSRTRLHIEGSGPRTRLPCARNGFHVQLLARFDGRTRATLSIYKGAAPPPRAADRDPKQSVNTRQCQPCGDRKEPSHKHKQPASLPPSDVHGPTSSPTM